MMGGGARTESQQFEAESKGVETHKHSVAGMSTSGEKNEVLDVRKAELDDDKGGESVLGSADVTGEPAIEHDKLSTCQVLERYMPDPSLKYSKVPFSGPRTWRTWGPVVLLLLGMTVMMISLVTLASYHGRMGTWLGLSLGSVAVLVGAGGLWFVWREAWLRVCLWRELGAIELGTDRAVPQPGTKLRFEAHFRARRRLRIEKASVRFMFWERWNVRRNVRWLGISYVGTAKHGHDLDKSETGPIDLEKGQHAVFRGVLRVPEGRPSEHRRGELGHVSYVNVTTTVMLRRRCGAEEVLGGAPQLTTFPWQ